MEKWKLKKKTTLHKTVHSVQIHAERILIKLKAWFFQLSIDKDDLYKKGLNKGVAKVNKRENNLLQNQEKSHCDDPKIFWTFENFVPIMINI